jgi:hypothetical protein
LLGFFFLLAQVRPHVAEHEGPLQGRAERGGQEGHRQREEEVVLRARGRGVLDEALDDIGGIRAGDGQAKGREQDAAEAEPAA